MLQRHRSRKTRSRKHLKIRLFFYSFGLLDIQSKIYIAFGMSFKSETEAFDRAMKMLRDIDVEIESVRLDKYYSLLSYVDRDANVYVIP